MQINYNRLSNISNAFTNSRHHCDELINIQLHCSVTYLNKLPKELKSTDNSKNCKCKYKTQILTLVKLQFLIELAICTRLPLGTEIRVTNVDIRRIRIIAYENTNCPKTIQGTLDEFYRALVFPIGRMQFQSSRDDDYDESESRI